ncbi:DUF2845 domain-containing protein [Salinisphaera sp. LB1]|uniref:DUF2845 domain-containing protein n=1 Tax=Salinisphaera sp. LB1 TaxID=2183911 RepID=UPI000D7E7F3B|nr:DUF2845 domain-containing protein [Salinisphaera sp. LB1]AWN17316.1 hypothetical protein SALB1_3122 [Salinisphaera sp. LB1]
MLVTLILSAGLLPPAARADSLRCNGHLVTDGDPAARVVRACGPPSFRDPWWGAAPATGVPPMMEWTYNRGPRRLMDQIVFRDGRVISIATAGYGFRAGSLPPNGHCNPASIVSGLSKYALLEACGEPVQRSGGYVNSTRYDDGTHRLFLRHAAHPVYRERWIYNFGSDRLMREVTLENARVVSVQTLERGFGPH